MVQNKARLFMHHAVIFVICQGFHKFSSKSNSFRENSSLTMPDVNVHGQLHAYLHYLQEEIMKYDKILEDAYLAAKKETVTRNSDWLDSPWPGFFQQKDAMAKVNTGVKDETLNHIAHKFSEIPPDNDFTLHGGK